MKHLFVPYELALLLKEKGFKELCLALYKPTMQWYKERTGIEIELAFPQNVIGHIPKIDPSLLKKENIAAPLYQQVIDWLREKHSIHLYIETTPAFDKTQGGKFKVAIKYCFQPFKWTTGHYCLADTYYEALTKAIEEALKLI